MNIISSYKKPIRKWIAFLCLKDSIGGSNGPYRGFFEPHRLRVWDSKEKAVDGILDDLYEYGDSIGIRVDGVVDSRNAPDEEHFYHVSAKITQIAIGSENSIHDLNQYLYFRVLEEEICPFSLQLTRFLPQG